MRHLATLVHKQLRPIYRKQGGAVADVLLLWPRLAPDWYTLAQPVKLSRGVLTLATANSAVAQQIQLEQMSFLQRCDQMLGSEFITQVKFMAGGLPAAAPRPMAPAPKAKTVAAEQTAAEPRDALRASLQNLGRLIGQTPPKGRE